MDTDRTNEFLVKRYKSSSPSNLQNLSFNDSCLVSNDMNVHVSRYKNAKLIYEYLLKQKEYTTKKEFIYCNYWSILYRSINKAHRNRILYEYFYNKKFSKIIGSIHRTLESFNEFKEAVQKYCIRFLKSFLNEDEFKQVDNKDLYNEVDIEEMYRRYLNTNNESYKIFKNEFSKNAFTFFTSTEKVKNISNFNFEFYYFLLKDIEMNYGLLDKKDTVKRFYFLLLDLYEDGEIYYKMEYKEVENLVKDTCLYKKLKYTKYNPSDIYYYFLNKLEDRISKSNLMEIDKIAIAKYKKILEMSKEEGEL